MYRYETATLLRLTCTRNRTKDTKIPEPDTSIEHLNIHIQSNIQHLTSNNKDGKTST